MDQQKNNRIDEILQSLDGVKRATPSPYLLTRLYARMAISGRMSIWDQIVMVISRPAVAFTSIALLLALNIIILANKNYRINTHGTAQEMAGAEQDDFATRFNSIDYIENLAP